jgi:hypothetical protein
MNTMMTTYRLIKSHNQWSSGTKVRLLSLNEKIGIARVKTLSSIGGTGQKAEFDIPIYKLDEIRKKGK